VVRYGKDKKGDKMIIIDSKEANTKVAQRLSKLLPVEIMSLETGDYVVGEIIIERMSLSDFLNKVRSGRLWQQLSKLASVESHKPRIIIEGSFGLIYKLKRKREEDGRIVEERVLNWSENQLYGLLEAIIDRYKIPILNFSSAYWTVNYISYLNFKSGGKINKQVRFQKPSETLAQKQIYFVSGLPNVGCELAKRLLEHFRTVKAIMNADVEQLMQVRGIGRKTAAEIYEVVNSEYPKE
jgi:Fanconi anemia group M protein